MRTSTKLLGFGLPTVASLAGLLTLMVPGEPAHAARNLCLEKYHRCQARCMYKPDFTSCVNRTCNRQFDNCVVSGTGGTRK